MGPEANRFVFAHDEPDRFDEGIEDLFRTTETDGVFCYAGFRAVATA